MNLHQLHARLAAVAARVPSAMAPRVPTSEEAIREVQALVDQMKAEGAVIPDTSEPMSPAEEAALIARALKQAAIEPTQAVSP